MKTRSLLQLISLRKINKILHVEQKNQMSFNRRAATSLTRINKTQWSTVTIRDKHEMKVLIVEMCRVVDSPLQAMTVIAAGYFHSWTKWRGKPHAVSVDRQLKEWQCCLHVICKVNDALVMMHSEALIKLREAWHLKSDLFFHIIKQQLSRNSPGLRS